MFKTHGTALARGRHLALLTIFAALAAAAVAAMIACESEEAEVGFAPTASPAPATPEAEPTPEVLSLAPSGSATMGTNELVLAWKPMPDINRFVLCETTPPLGTECEERVGVSEATVAVPGPADDRQSSGTWLKYLWLQSCAEHECSRPPTAAGAIAHRIVYDTSVSDFIVVVRRLEANQVEVALANASHGRPDTSTIIARTPDGLEIARCTNVAPGEWCGPFEGTLMSNEIAAEQIYGDTSATVEFPLMPSTTAPQPTPRPTP